MCRGSTTVLILGGSVMQLPAIRIAHEMDWKVIIADIDPHCPGADLADIFERVSLSDKEGMLDMARRHHSSGHLDGVFTAGTDFSATVAYVSENLGLPGVPFETALDASDKSRMRAVFEQSGIPSPMFVSLTAEDDLILDDLPFSPPFVVKPVDSMGARGIRRVDTTEELAAAIGDAFPYTRSGRVIVEEYIDGPEFSLDALVYDGQITLCGIADRHIFFPPYFVEMGHTMPSSYPSAIKKEVIEVFYEGIRALGIRFGAAKGDVKYGSSGPVIGEIAARLSGGYMSGWTYPLASGVEPTKGGLRISVGMDPGNLSPIRQTFSAERAYISIPGVVEEIVGVQKAERMPDVRHHFPRSVAGDTVVFPTNNVQKAGNIITQSEVREDAIAAAEAAVQAICIRLEPGNRITARFLFDESEPWVPAAYSIDDPENQSVLELMAATTGGGDGPYMRIPHPEKELSRDWMGTSFSAALSKVDMLLGSLSPRDETLASLFWQAFTRGGYQGAAWAVETAERAKRATIDIVTAVRRGI